MKAQLRLAMRREGNFWNAYVAEVGTMEKAFLIGSIAIAPVMVDIELKNKFQQLMQDILTLMLEKTIGETVKDWTVKPGPESERSGNA